MHTLLGYVKRDKYVDPLAEKLALRLGAVAEVRTAAGTAAFGILPHMLDPASNQHLLARSARCQRCLGAAQCACSAR